MNNRFKLCNCLKKTECINLLKANLSYDELKTAIEPTQAQILKLMNAFTKSDLQNIIYNTPKINMNIIAEAIKNNNELMSEAKEIPQEEVIVIKKLPQNVEPQLKPKVEKAEVIQIDRPTKITIGENLNMDETAIVPFNENEKKELLDYDFYFNAYNKIESYKLLLQKIREDKLPKEMYEKYLTERKQDLIIKLNKIKKGDYNEFKLKDLYEIYFCMI